jgi:uncharacterized protein YjdB
MGQTMSIQFSIVDSISVVTGLNVTPDESTILVGGTTQLTATLSLPTVTN